MLSRRLIIPKESVKKARFGEDMIRMMKQNETINVLFLLFCMMLLGFVYVNTKMGTNFHQKAKTENTKSTVQPDRGI